MGFSGNPSCSEVGWQSSTDQQGGSDRVFNLFLECSFGGSIQPNCPEVFGSDVQSSGSVFISGVHLRKTGLIKNSPGLEALICVLSHDLRSWLTVVHPESGKSQHRAATGITMIFLIGQGITFTLARCARGGSEENQDKSLWTDSNSRPQPWQGCALPTEIKSQQ